MLRSLDSLVRSNLWVYNQARRSAVFLCRYVLLEEGFSFLRHIEPMSGAIAVDVGSNDGTSIEMIRQIHPMVPIHSFDPVTSPSKSHANLTFHDVALSDSLGILNLYIPKVRRWTLTQYSSTDHEKIAAQLMEDFDLSREEVEFTRKQSECVLLDSLELNPFFIKIDVEGQEEAVVRGAIGTIVAHKPVLLIEIQSFEGYRSMQNLMREVGYFNLRWPQSRKDGFAQTPGHYSRRRNNYLWIPNSNSKNWTPKKVR